MDSNNAMLKNLASSIQTKQTMLADKALLDTITQIAHLLVMAFKDGKKVLFCGNGGSAADAQHLAAELSGRYYYDRPPLFAEALHVNTSYLTAVANDYSFDEVYARMIRAIGQEGDVLIGLSTSGNSANVLRAIEDARSLQMHTIGFTGAGGGRLKTSCDHWVPVPSNDTPRIQECHMLIGHTLCEIVEQAMFPKL